MTPEQAASMHPGLWLAGTLGRQRRDGAVIRWATDPKHLVTVPCGVRWDAIAMSHSTGARVLEELLRAPEPEEIGPVLADSRFDRCYWLIPLGSFPTCKAMPSEVRLLLPGQGLEVPDPDPAPTYDPGSAGDVLQPVTWEHWPATNGTLTPPRRLVSLLTGLRQTRTSHCLAATIRRPGAGPRRSLPPRTHPPQRKSTS